MKWNQSLFVIMAVAVLGGCAASSSSDALELPSCEQEIKTPLGEERVGSEEWVVRHILFHSKIGGIVRTVTAHHANGEFQAPEGGWELSFKPEWLTEDSYSGTFNVFAEKKTNPNNNRLQKRDVTVRLHMFGPKMGFLVGNLYFIRMEALKYRDHPDTHWVFCPKF